MNKTLEGMAQTAWERRDVGSWSYVGDGAKRVLCDDQRAALLWLAANVSDEMVQEANERFNRTLWADTEAGRKSLFKLLVETALRAAAGGGEK